MTVTTVTNKVTYTGNGVTTVFSFTFPVFDTDDLVLYLYEIATQTLSVLSPANYSVVLGDGEVTYNPGGIPLPATHKLIITRIVALTQDLDLVNQGGFYPDSIEDQFDLLEMQIQQINEAQSRSLQIQLGDPAVDVADLLGDIEGAAAAGAAAAASAAAAAVSEAAAIAAASNAETVITAFAALPYTFSTTTADADPGAGTFRLNHATPASATALYIDNVDVDGVTQSGEFTAWDDSSNTVRGQVTIRSKTVPATKYVFSVTGSVVDGTGYRKVTLTYVSGSGSLANGAACWIFFSRSGDAGDITADGVQTLTNKTLTAPTINNPVVNAPTITDPIGRLIAGLLYGLTLSNDGTDPTNDIGVAVGTAASNDAVPAIMTLFSAIIKRLDAAWVVGTNQGGLDTGAIADGTYHVWLIRRPDTGVTDILFSISATAPTMPANYTQKRRIGAIVRSAGAIRAFKQDGDYFEWVAPIIDRTSTAALASSLLGVSVPGGISVRPNFFSNLRAAAASAINNFMGSADAGSANTTVQCSVDANIHGDMITNCFKTNTSAQIYFAVVIGGGSITTNILETVGYFDTRGREG